MIADLWEQASFGGESYALMNLDHSSVEERVRLDMDAGIAVYYDRRWSATAVLAEWLAQNLHLVKGKRVLVLGAGIGEETLVLGRYCSHLWINDLAPAALELCAEQLDQNGIQNYTAMLGRFEELDLPEVDLVVAGFFIYNKDTLTSMRSFLKGHVGDLILVNERLQPFRKFLKLETHSVIFDEEDGAVGVLLQRD